LEKGAGRTFDYELLVQSRADVKVHEHPVHREAQARVAHDAADLREEARIRVIR
jgi:hypothetical protein